MSQKLNILKLLAITAISIASASASFAGTSGWINANDFERFNKRVLRKGNLPTKISCKNSNQVVGMDRKNTIINVTYKKNTENVRWSWAWGNRVGQIDYKNSKKGYKLVSQDSFKRPSGLLMKCAIWHKK